MAVIETCTTYAGQERRFNTFHLRSICRILGRPISWYDRVSNSDVLSRARLPICNICLDNADYGGWVVWRMVESENTASTVSWHWGGEPPAVLRCDIKMLAWEIWRLPTSTLCPGRILQLTAQSGGVHWNIIWREGNINWWLLQRTSDHSAIPWHPRPHIDASVQCTCIIQTHLVFHLPV